jgi:hypothetical protein
MTKRNRTNYIVRAQRGDGAGYLTRRVNVTRTSGRYRWAKESRNVATVLSYDAARRAARQYGGCVVPV